ncbi:MAG: metallophosphoesterase family protein [Dissulfurimicrobium sp.]|uniref:metallophosphoesterase family protein n=1 Tax=Dissulfurimicrobium sp. TaxID=2022436 RepID=UPI00404A235D
MKPFRFVHAADIHLDSPFKGLNTREPDVAGFLRKAGFLAFNNLIDLCIQNKADFLVIAGDIFDQPDRSLKAQLAFRDGIERLRAHEIRVFAVFGNHDPLSGRQSPVDWPENVHFFSHDDVEEIMVEVSGEIIASVSGISYRDAAERRNLAKRFKRRREGLFNIGILHSNVGGEKGHEPYAPCDLSDLVNAGMDYWALGHVHERKILCKNPHIIYPGNIQGRSIREQGERGCFLVSVDSSGRVNLDFKPLDAARWASMNINIGPFNSIDQLEAAIFSAIEALSKRAEQRPVICHISLTGRGPMYSELRRDKAADDLIQRAREKFLGMDPFVWINGLSIACAPEIDIERRRQVDDFTGFMLRKVDELRSSKEAQAVLFNDVLNQLFSNYRVRRAIGGLTPNELEEMLEEARLLCLDMLEGGDI